MSQAQTTIVADPVAIEKAAPKPGAAAGKRKQNRDFWPPARRRAVAGNAAAA